MTKGLKSHLTSRQAKYGLNTLIYSLVALAIVVAVNLIAKQFVRQLDLTANQRYSLSQQTANILSGLDRRPGSRRLCPSNRFQPVAPSTSSMVGTISMDWAFVSFIPEG